MKLFFTDESHADDSSKQGWDCFCYGGIVVPEHLIKETSQFVYQQKIEANIPQEAELKWGFADFLKKLKKKLPDTDPRKDLSKEKNEELYTETKKQYDNLKSNVLNYVKDHPEITIIITVRPISLLRMSMVTDREKLFTYSLNEVAEKFQEILTKTETLGVLAADNYLPSKNEAEQYPAIIDLGLKGTKLSSLESLLWILPNIISELSPIHQINDIILGSFCNYLGASIEQKINGSTTKIETARNLVKIIVPNFYSRLSVEGKPIVISNGLLFQPTPYNRKPNITGNYLNALEQQVRTDFDIS